MAFHHAPESRFEGFVFEKKHPETRPIFCIRIFFRVFLCLQPSNPSDTKNLGSSTQPFRPVGFDESSCLWRLGLLRSSPKSLTTS